MQRGPYGIEYEPSDSRVSRKFLSGLIFVPVAVVAFLFYRGCDSDVSPAHIAGEETIKIGPEQGEEGKRNVLDKIIEPQRSSAAAQTRKVEQPAQAERSKPVVATPSVPKNITVPDSVQREINAADIRLKQDDLLGARSKLLALLKLPESKPVQEFIEKKVSAINEKLLFSNRPMPGKIAYLVVAGDSIGKIARKFNTTVDFIISENGIDNPAALAIGKELWVLNNPAFELTVEKKSFSAVLTLNGEFFKRYTVGLGPESDIPSGAYALRSRSKNPVYRRAGQKSIAFGMPGNILGTSLLSLSAINESLQIVGVSLHGTWVNASLGCRNEDGRIRFRNSDIEQLTKLMPIGSAVNIVD